MEGTSIVIPAFNKSALTQKCIRHIRSMNPNCAFEIIIVDNGSTDNTQEIFSGESNIVYIKNEDNVGLSRAYNQAGKTAIFDTLCFMHNDVFVFQEAWVDIVRNFITTTPDAGIVGLYGAKTIRRDGSFRGKSIVHALRGNPSIHKPFEKSVVIDGLLMAMHRSVFDSTEGYDERFSIHFYDKSISMCSHSKGYTNYVLNIPFEHQCGSTRQDVTGENDVREESRRKFISLWGNSLPADVSTLTEKISCIFKKQPNRK